MKSNLHKLSIDLFPIHSAIFTFLHRFHFITIHPFSFNFSNLSAQSYLLLCFTIFFLFPYLLLICFSTSLPLSSVMSPFLLCFPILSWIKDHDNVCFGHAAHDIITPVTSLTNTIEHYADTNKDGFLSNWEFYPRI